MLPTFLRPGNSEAAEGFRIWWGSSRSFDGTDVAPNSAKIWMGAIALMSPWFPHPCSIINLKLHLNKRRSGCYCYYWKAAAVVGNDLKMKTEAQCRGI